MTRTSNLVLLLALAGCAAPVLKPAPNPPAPVVIQPEKPAPARPMPVALCSEEQPPAEPVCEAGTQACRDAYAAWMKASNDYVLRCEPIRPASPIAGEAIEVIYPYGPDSSGECTAGETNVTRTREGDVTVIHIDNGTHGMCSQIGSLPLTELGVLTAGRYRIDTGHWQHDFEVRPEGSDPGDLDERVVVAMEVARVHHVGQCFGMPGDFPTFGQPFAQTRLANQLKKAFPKDSAEALEGLFVSARAIAIEPTGTSQWTFRYTNGACCIISQMQGEVTRAFDGTWLVGPANAISSESVPC
jgi:hypothetical protein